MPVRHATSQSRLANVALTHSREIGIAMVLAAGIGALALLAPEPNTLLASAVRDFARFLILALISYTAFRIVAALGFLRMWTALVITVASLSLGIGVELFEMSSGDGFSERDVAMDLAACVSGLAAGQWRSLGGRPEGRMAWFAMTLMLLLVAALPFGSTLQAYIERRANFPVLLDAQRDADLGWVRQMPEPVRIGPVDGALQREPGERAFIVPFDAGVMPGLAIDEPYGDWSGLRTLAIDLINPGDTMLDLILNVDDMRGSGEPGDRYDERVVLPPRSRKVLRTPLENMVRSIPHRRFALDDMDIVMIYRTGPAAGERVMVRRIWLE